MNIAALRTELITDPLPRGYSGMTDAQAAANLNDATTPALRRTRDRGVIPAYEVIDATVPSEYTTLNADEKQRYAAITGAGSVNTKNTNTRAAFAAMFGAGTTTRTNLVALQTEFISRAQELGLGTVTAQDVKDARGAA